MVNEDKKYTLHFGEPRGDYNTDKFPFSFDNMTCISESLLIKSFELMGFGDVYPIEGNELPSFGWNGYNLKGFLGIR